MTRTEMIDAINAWADISHDDTDLIDALGQGDSFIFDFPNYISSSDYIHAYPAIHNGDLYFLLIPEEYDNSTYSTTFNSYVSVCPITRGGGSAPTSTAISSSGTKRITQTAATARIDRWNDDYETWIPNQVSSTDGIFMAFAIPVDSFEVQQSQVYLSLNLVSSREVAELIVINKTSSHTYYDDYSQPVPPFGVTFPQSDFYLLSL